MVANASVPARGRAAGNSVYLRKFKYGMASKKAGLQLLTPYRNAILDTELSYTRFTHRPAVTVRQPLKSRDFWIILIRIVAIGIVLAGVSVGALQRYFSLATSKIVGADVDADLKLAFLGFFNKSLDVLLVSSLEYTASFVLTVWMARAGPQTQTQGAMFSDFGLKDELTKPWMTIVSFATRWKRSKWSWKSLLRCLFCLCISVSVMLQGLAINTIAVPKKRWYPNWGNGWPHLRGHDKEIMTVKYPKAYLQGIDWRNLLGVGQSNVEIDGYPPWDWALGLSASLSFMGLTHIRSTLARPEKSWQHVYRTTLDGDAWTRWTAVQTDFNDANRAVETISADNSQITGIFNWLRDTNHQPTASSVGWTGNLTILVPALNTLCVSTKALESELPFNVTVPDGDMSGYPSFSVDLAPVHSMNFSGARCTSTFRQALYSVSFWIVDMQSADLSFNDYGREWNKTISYEPTIANDYTILSALASQMRDSIASMAGLVPSTKLLPQFLLISRTLQKADPIVASDVAGLSIIMGVLLQNMLSMSNKQWQPLPTSLPTDPEARITSFPVQWQLYGSGPRLPWEWITVLVLLIVLISFCVGMYLILRYWMSPAPWTELDGMMMLAQKSPLLDDIREENEAQKKIYWVERDGSNEVVLKSKHFTKGRQNASATAMPTPSPVATPTSSIAATTTPSIATTSAPLPAAAPTTTPTAAPTSVNTSTIV
ncbi:hypothetical protein T440DRAFT_538054 [Plenodomus tracheiphilus IPT5]|uniref:Uncharacterized protein n=1 Tax=Plenodomus tracheiphilus IPT5 TaxID=1408161 RepID=A0A6A7AXC2_9PLEO|nr:hypothetical protein T440DRAFT_538054 [Plenodomus tracheiphilus IPT5]